MALCALPLPAFGAISFDSASRTASTTAISSLTWSHTLGGGSDRIVIIGVACEDTTATNANVLSVTFNGASATAVPNSKISGGGTGIIQTQLFYVLNASLPAAGTYSVKVTFQGSIQGASVGAVSLAGVRQSGPEAVTAKTDTSGADSISTSITPLTSGAWVVDVVGSGNSGTFTAGSGQTARWSIAASGMTGASSNKVAASPGAMTLSWTHSGANRLAHSLASFAPSAGGVPTPTPTPTPTPSPTPTPTPTPSPTPTPGAPDFHLFGFAAGVTTGGKGGQTVTVSTLAALQSAAANTSSMIIQVSGKITGTTGSDIVRVASNKTIVGLGSTAELFAVELSLANSSNIIVRNLKISHVLASNNDGDLIHLQETHNVWIDHCELFNEPPQTQPNKDLYDGLVDITHNSSNVTISWTFFHDHWKSNLIGSSDSDNFDRTTTFHHNMYNNIASRTPSYRFGHGHVYNTYFTGIMLTGVNSRMGAVLRVEGNVFENASDPITSQDSAQVGFWDVIDNQFVNCTGNQPTTSNGTFVPPYVYHLDSSAQVKALVIQWSGVGKTDPLQNLP
jgi:pectate lyase